MWLSTSSRMRLITRLKSDAVVASVANIDTLMLRRRPAKKSRKEGTQGSVAIPEAQQSPNWLCVSRFRSEEVYSTVSWRIEIERFGGHTLMKIKKHIEPRVQLYVPKRKETLLIPQKCIDITRSTRTDLNVAQEKRIDDYWNIDENRSLSDSWTGFTKFTLLKETPRKGYLWSGVRLTKIQTTARPDHVWPEAWTRIGKAAERKEKQEWALEKTKLENARSLRGNYHVDPSDEAFCDILKNARNSNGICNAM